MFPILVARVWSFVKAHPKWFLVPAALAAAYFAGFYSRPAKVSTNEVVKTQIQYQDRVVEHEAKERVVYRNVVRTVTVTKQPNGATTTTTTVADRSTDHTDTHIDATRTDTGTTKTEVAKTTVLSSQPNWAVRGFGLLELTGPAPLTGGVKTIDPIVLYGVGVDRRLWGPLWLGVSGGGSYDFRTRANGWWVGVSTAVTFTF